MDPPSLTAGDGESGVGPGGATASPNKKTFRDNHEVKRELSLLLLVPGLSVLRKGERWMTRTQGSRLLTAWGCPEGLKKRGGEEREEDGVRRGRERERETRERGEEEERETE